MDIRDLAKEYRESAKAIKARIKELNEQIKESDFNDAEERRMKDRIYTLRKLAGDTDAIALHLERYCKAAGEEK